MSENHVSKNEQDESMITRDEVILQWFLQPGNFARYLKADGRLKHGTESKGAMALEVIEQLQASGNDTPKKKVMIIRLTKWQRALIKAHQLATSGSYDEQVISKVYPYYYRVADVLGPVVDNMPGGNTSTDHVTSSRATPASTLNSSILPSPLGHQTTPSYLMPLSCGRLSFQGNHRLLFRPRRYSIESQ
ncbi:hypothetical protein K492DRAFT_196768 [Lichtheimia hyalospora FSU 10163]|nr:hypothetical protein K492DRAFT_196768 [Lichtheimia hyalospora FSU 10163]